MTGSALPSRVKPDQLYLFLDIAASETAGAHLDGHGCSTEFGLYRHDIRFPLTTGVIIGLADLVSTDRSLTANFTSPGHN